MSRLFKSLIIRERPDQQIDYMAAVLKLAASVTTMGFGASTGMEGACKWLRGTIASYLQWFFWFAGSAMIGILYGHSGRP